ncbi:MAG: N-acetylmuramoyl-L-alanine amidase [Eubacteriaceae bacterium]|jgi:N-acetylmuramoyl-L-alanine amidase|nr:N-acetylmuramoyl-L-alanine amidase [Eubacteriaceae bacterium]
MPKIAVFAGHGGADPGAVAFGVYEKTKNLAISNTVTAILRSHGVEVINNRTEDVNRSLTADIALANRSNVDGVLEIHHNSNAGTPGTGTEAFHTKNGGKGKVFATALTKAVASLGYVNRGPKIMLNTSGRDYLGIIRETYAPASLLEVCFLNNSNDMMRHDIYSISNAIAYAVMEVFGSGYYEADPNILEIQWKINELYGLNIAEDGYFGPITKSAIVKSLQLELNRGYGASLAVDGAFGPATKAATVSVRRGNPYSNLVYIIQSGLYTRGNKSVIPDGLFGPITETAALAFQRSQGLAVDGIVGPNTQEMLFR